MEAIALQRLSETVWQAYKVVFEIRYKMRPPNMDGRTNDKFIGTLGRIKAHHAAVIEHYLDMPGPNEWFLKRGHSIGCFINNAPIVYADYCAKNLGSGPNQGGGSVRGIRVVTKLYCGNALCESGDPKGEFPDTAILSTEIDDWVCPQCKALHTAKPV